MEGSVIFFSYYNGFWLRVLPENKQLLSVKILSALLKMIFSTLKIGNNTIIPTSGDAQYQYIPVVFDTIDQLMISMKAFFISSAPSSQSS